MAVSDLIAASIAALFFSQAPAAPAARAVVDAPCAPLMRLAEIRRPDAQRLWAPIGCIEVAPRLSVTGLVSWATGYDPSMVVPNAGERREQIAVAGLPDVTDPDPISRIIRLVVVDLRGKDRGLELDRTELACLQRALYFEARGEGMLGQAAVAHVALNRVNSRPSRTTICEVVTEPGQFAPYLNGEPDEADLIQTDEEATRIAAETAAYVMAGYVPDPSRGGR
ncbi:MAG: cell wall hydrolase, partial [Alphaproteobacteria bacterium]|nr:cell wall hydrolase [Alphaproteobacteria bacterium]